jgi:adenosylcobinamide-phosphate synthase
MKRTKPFILLFAFLIDLLFGDPPNQFHPVAWMGTLLSRMKVMFYKPRQSPQNQFISGLITSISGGIIVGGIGSWLENKSNKLPAIPAGLLQAVVLKSTFTYRGLDRAAGEVQNSLEKKNIDQARKSLSHHLVSRDTSSLTESEISAAAIESVAENVSDSLIAPLFFYTIGGLPLALIYRLVNTADAMFGYKDQTHYWFGKFPARLDDLLNILPARISGHLISLASSRTGRTKQAFITMHRDAGQTDSPNAGWPMSAMAGGLGVRLEKKDHYILGSEYPDAAPEKLRQSRTIFRRAAFLGLGLMVLLSTRKRN